MSSKSKKNKPHRLLQIMHSDLPAAIKQKKIARLVFLPYTNPPDHEKPFKFEGPKKTKERVEWIAPVIRKLMHRRLEEQK